MSLYGAKNVNDYLSLIVYLTEMAALDFNKVSGRDNEIGAEVRNVTKETPKSSTVVNLKNSK